MKARPVVKSPEGWARFNERAEHGRTRATAKLREAKRLKAGRGKGRA